MKLCALADVKTMLNIATLDTAKDAKINLMIDQVSAFVCRHLGYNPQRTVITNELHAINNRQYIQLDAQPVQSVQQVLLAGAEITDYGLAAGDLAVGLLYRGAGWCGSYYVRGATEDPVAGVRDISVSYTAGWRLPGDQGYAAGASDSLPLDIQGAVMQDVIRWFRMNERESEGLKSHSEGGISDTFGDSASGAGGSLSEASRSALASYARIAIG